MTLRSPRPKAARFAFEIGERVELKKHLETGEGIVSHAHTKNGRPTYNVDFDGVNREVDAREIRRPY